MDHRLDARLMQLSPGALHAAIGRICEIDEFKGWWGGRDRFDSLDSDAIANRVADESVSAFLRLEGRHMEGSASVRFFEGHESPAHAGYAAVLRSVLAAYPELVFGEDLLLQLHARLLAHSPEAKAQLGRYRTRVDRIGSGRRARMEPVALMPTAAHLVPGETRALVEWTTSRLAYSDFHPLIVVASFVLEFLAIRPFADGNGRLVRILTNLLLVQSGYTHVGCTSLDAVLAGRWTQCHLALRRSQATRNLPRPDIAPWLGAFLDALREHVTRVRALVDRRPDERLLSANQRGVLRLMERNGEITNRLVCRELRLPRETAKQVLKRLVSLGLVERIGAGRSVRYRGPGGQGNGAR